MILALLLLSGATLTGVLVLLAGYYAGRDKDADEYLVGFRMPDTKAEDDD